MEEGWGNDIHVGGDEYSDGDASTIGLMSENELITENEYDFTTDKGEMWIREKCG